MADKNSLIEQMLEHLVNDEQDKAEELFHEFVVQKSRDIYEGLIESEIEDEDEDEDVEEAFGDDPTDKLAGELGGDDDMGDDDMDDMGDDDMGDMEEESEEELFQDLDDIVEKLQAKFDELKGDESAAGEMDDMDDMGDDDMGDMEDDEEIKDDFDLKTVREYVEKVPAGHGAEKKGQAEKADGSAGGMKFSKNDMGGTASNILSGRNGADAGLANQGQLKGSGLLKGAPQDMKTGNINTPGAKNGNAFSKKEPGHGAEKKGAAEGSTDGQSLFRGRR